MIDREEKKYLLEKLLNDKDIIEIRYKFQDTLKYYEVMGWMVELGYLDKFINNPKRCGELGINRSVLKLIATGRAEDYLDNPRDYEDILLDSWDIADLIIFTGRADSFLSEPKKCDELGLDGFDKIELIKIEDRVDEYIDNPQKCDELRLTSEERRYLIETADRIEEFVNHPEKCKKLKLNSIDIVELIRTSGNEFDILYDTQRLKKFDSAVIERLMRESLSKKKVRRMVNNQELCKELGLSNGVILELRKDVELEKEISNSKRKLLNENRKYKRIGLNPDMTIGIEIETVESKKGAANLIVDKPRLLGRWDCKADGSIKDGCEITSPILKDTEQDVEEIYIICEYLNRLRTSGYRNLWWTCTYWLTIFIKARII